MSEKTESIRDGDVDAAPVATREELAAQVAELEETMTALNNLLSSFSARMLRNVDDLKDEMNRRVSFGDLQPVQKELERIRAKIGDIVDEVGYGEALDITKVPPYILEAAYQAILDDVVGELKNVRGLHDAELHIQHSLEQLRLKTSGSELFHYKPHRLHVGVAKPLEKGLISARQVQSTYNELMRHLLEPIHTYTPKNFRALIKIKSQEYAVDKALTLAKDVERAGPRIQELESRAHRLEEQVTGALRDLQDFAAKLQITLSSIATRESVEALGMRIADLERRLQEAPKGETVAVRTPPAIDAATIESVLQSLSSEPRSSVALKKELGLDETTLKAILEDLEARGRIASSIRGRYTMYRLKEANENA